MNTQDLHKSQIARFLLPARGEEHDPLLVILERRKQVTGRQTYPCFVWDKLLAADVEAIKKHRTSVKYVCFT
ncbi:hypothetical protein DMC47_09910 [Nostoc sp. 3335mG]|nr:hypothetical protein DMC47_09910 [Nostoc sp. 3335mG]